MPVAASLVMLIIITITLGTNILFKIPNLTIFAGLVSGGLGVVSYGIYNMIQKYSKIEYQGIVDELKEISGESEQYLNDYKKEELVILGEINSLTEEEKIKLETAIKRKNIEDTLLKQEYQKGVSEFHMHQTKEKLLMERENLLFQKEENDMFQRELELAYELGTSGTILNFKEDGIELVETPLELKQVKKS